MAIESKCNMPQQPDYTGVTIVELSPNPALDDYLQAMCLAYEKAEALIGDNMSRRGTTKIVILSRRSTPVNVMLIVQYRVI